MDRRNAVKNLAMAAGGLVALPFWMTACRSGDGDTPQQTLSAAVDAIIPPGNIEIDHGSGGAVTIGALSLGVDIFLEKVLADCYEKSVQENVQRQLAAIEALARKEYGTSFAASSLPHRQEMIMKGLQSNNKDEKDSWMLLKNETIRGFNTSRQVMEDVLKYKIAPGVFYGCVAINA